MREIKFRAWDKRTNKMLIVTTLDIMRNSSNQYLNTCGGYNEDDGQHQPSWAFDEFPIMQYTGLKDKNGKEIYEGDIYRSRLNTKFPYTIEVVVWSEQQQGWAPRIPQTENSTMEYAHRGEIIGNIYENPELLTN